MLPFKTVKLRAFLCLMAFAASGFQRFQQQNVTATVGLRTPALTVGPLEQESSAMVVTPALRGLFGLNWDAPPLEFTRAGGRLIVRARSATGAVPCLASTEAPAAPCASPDLRERWLELPLPAAEIEDPHQWGSPPARPRYN